MRLTILLFLITLSSSTYAHIDKTFTFQYDKTYISITTSFYNEEVEKVKIIGKLVSKLANKYGYNDKIIINFIHKGGDRKKITQRTLNYSNPVYKYSGEYGSYVDSIKHQGDFLFLREYNTRFNIEETIKLIEFGLNNTKYIKNASYINAEPYSCVTISEDKIQSIVKDDIQKNGKNIIGHKVYKEEAIPPEISYFSKDGKFTLFRRETDGSETLIDTLNNIHSIISSSHDYFVFTDWDEFHYYNRYNDGNLSSDAYKIHFQDNNREITPIKVEELNNETFLIYHSAILWHEPLNVALFNTNQGIKIDNLLE